MSDGYRRVVRALREKAESEPDEDLGPLPRVTESLSMLHETQGTLLMLAAKAERIVESLLDVEKG